MAPHSSTLAWKIPWMEELGRLQSMGSLRVGDDWATSLWLFIFMHQRRKWQPTPVFLPRESQGQRSLVGCHLWGRTESVGHDWSNLVVVVVVVVWGSTDFTFLFLSNYISPLFPPSTLSFFTNPQTLWASLWPKDFAQNPGFALRTLPINNAIFHLLWVLTQFSIS